MSISFYFIFFQPQWWQRCGKKFEFYTIFPYLDIIEIELANKISRDSYRYGACNILCGQPD